MNFFQRPEDLSIAGDLVAADGQATPSHERDRFPRTEEHPRPRSGGNIDHYRRQFSCRDELTDEAEVLLARSRYERDRLLIPERRQQHRFEQRS